MSHPVRVRQVRRALHGVLLLDKPLGWTSNDALQKAKWLLRAEKAGHTGTLDPLATGLLPLCFGAATKFSQVSLDADKAYCATLGLGRRTSTGDLEGEVLQQRPVNIDRALIEQVLQRFTGPIAQVPPMHSALKKDGRALYEYARAGLEVERAARQVIGIDADAVAAHPSWSKGQKIPLRGRRVQHVVHRKADLIEDHGHFIDEGNVDVALGVLDGLGGLPPP